MRQQWSYVFLALTHGMVQTQASHDDGIPLALFPYTDSITLGYQFGNFHLKGKTICRQFCLSEHEQAWIREMIQNLNLYFQYNIINKPLGSVFYLQLSKVSANEGREYIYNIFLHRLSPCWAINRKLVWHGHWKFYWKLFIALPLFHAQW